MMITMRISTRISTIKIYAKDNDDDDRDDDDDDDDKTIIVIEAHHTYT